jgi:tryptophan synthase alpha chain
MSRIRTAFAQKKGFVGYLTAGDGHSKEAFLSLVRGGVNLLEIGIPFSDPVADGPTIQRAMERSLQSGTTPEKVLQMVEELRKETDVPLVLFTYLNPIQKDLKGFLNRAKQVGVDGILIVDLPLEEGASYCQFCKEIGLAPIFVIAPSTPRARIAAITEAAAETDGFIYYACRKGTTGARDGLPEDYAEKIAEIRKHTLLPIAVGFGIADRMAAAALLKEADGFVVGSYFIDGMEKGKNIQNLAEGLRP